jgi:drug/metabolite transporter (DMT)-like permease
MAHIYAIVAAALFCTVAGQLLFRGAALAANKNATWLNLHSMSLFAIAIVSYGVMTILWANALREVSLSRAFPIMALAYLIIPLAEHQLYGQPLPWNTLAGGGVIIAGIALTQL